MNKILINVGERCLKGKFGRRKQNFSKNSNENFIMIQFELTINHEERETGFNYVKV